MSSLLGNYLARQHNLNADYGAQVGGVPLARRNALAAKLNAEMGHRFTPESTASVMDAYQEPIPIALQQETPLAGGVPTENVTGLELSPLDLIGSGLGTKAAAVLAKLGGHAGMAAFAGTFIGKGAKTWNAAMAEKALQMEAAGIAPETIWKETGTFRGADNMLRQEIDDSGAIIKKPFPTKGQSFGDVLKDMYATQGGEAKTVTDLLSHPEMAQSYDNILANKLTAGSSANGQFSNGVISLGNNLPMSNAKSTTLHELQHAIQQHEGFARGGSPEMFAKEANDTLQQVSAQNRLMSEIAKQKDEALKIGDRKKADLLTEKYNRVMEQREELVAKMQFDPYEAYRSLAGEAEARLTQARMNMSPLERGASYPPSMFDVPMDQQIVRFGEGKAMSVPDKFSRVVDVFGDGKNVKMYDDASGQYLHKLIMPNGEEQWQIGKMGNFEGKYAEYLDQPIGKKGKGLGNIQSFETPEEAIASLSAGKIAESARLRNAKYQSIPITWSGDEKQIAKKLIDEYGDIKFGQSTQSKSKYIVLPTGEKIRMSNHDLPANYDSPDFDFRYGSDKKAFLQEIKSKLNPQNALATALKGTE